MKVTHRRFKWKIMAFCIVSAFIFSGLVSIYFTTFTLEAYQYYIQSELYPCFFFLSFFSLLWFALKKEWKKALMFFLLPVLVYDFINYMAETVFYAKNIVSLNATTEVFVLQNINLSLGDLKISLAILSLIIWVWVYKKLVVK